MKTELILVGKTVNKHFIAGIKDYAERILSSRTPRVSANSSRRNGRVN